MDNVGRNGFEKCGTSVQIEKRNATGMESDLQKVNKILTFFGSDLKKSEQKKAVSSAKAAEVDAEKRNHKQFLKLPGGRFNFYQDHPENI